MKTFFAMTLALLLALSPAAALPSELPAPPLPEGGLYCYADAETGLILYEQHGLYGLMSPQGETVVEPTYVQPFFFSDGLAAVRLPDGFGYLLPDGTELLCGLDDAYPFCEGYAIAILGEHYGLLDKSGKWVLEPIYDGLTLPEGGVCAAVLAGEDVLVPVPEWVEVEP